MSKVSDIFDGLVTLIETTLGTDWVHIPNPYEIENNSQLYLRQGFAIGFGPADNTRAQVCPGKFFERRNYEILLLLEAVDSETNTEDRITSEKDIMDKGLLIKQAIDADVTLGDLAANSVYVNDTGIQYLAAVNDQEVNQNRNKFYLYSMFFDIEYSETV